MKNKTPDKLSVFAKILFYTISALCIITGLNYVVRGDLMPYHYSYLGKSADQIEKRTLILLISAAQLLGGFMIGLGATIGILTHNIEKYRNVVFPAIIVLGAFPLTMAFFIVYRIGETIPQVLVAVLITLFITGLILSYFAGRE